MPSWSHSDGETSTADQASAQATISSYKRSRVAALSNFESFSPSR